LSSFELLDAQLRHSPCTIFNLQLSNCECWVKRSNSAIHLAPKRCQLQSVNTFFNHDNLPPWLNHRWNSIGLYFLQTYLSRDGLSKVMLRSHNEGVKVLTLYQKGRPFHIGSEMTDTEQCTKWVQTQHDDKLWSNGNQEKNWIQEADEPLSTEIGKNSKTLLWSLKSH
jgi:hypothetical protein